MLGKCNKNTRQSPVENCFSDSKDSNSVKLIHSSLKSIIISLGILSISTSLFCGCAQPSKATIKAFDLGLKIALIYVKLGGLMRLLFSSWRWFLSLNCVGPSSSLPFSHCCAHNLFSSYYINYPIAKWIALFATTQRLTIKARSYFLWRDYHRSLEPTIVILRLTSSSMSSSLRNKWWLLWWLLRLHLLWNLEVPTNVQPKNHELQ